MRNHLFLDIHAIQALPPSNVNRDRTGSPKSCRYGGVERARISSQSLKRQIRGYFQEHMEENDLGVRTLDLGPYLAQRVQKIDPKFDYKEAIKRAEKIFKILDLKSGKSKTASDGHQVLKSMIFIGNQQADGLARAIIDNKTDKKKNGKEIKSIMKDNLSVDLALFGRMIAGGEDMNVDASSQVSHAISTHAIKKELDFFTANSDFKQDPDNAGAGMIGDTQYTSATLYRYANITAHHLLEQLNGDVDKTVRTMRLFIQAFALTMPTGHITSFANQTLPDAFVVTVRDDRPINLINGFEEPVTTQGGYTRPSIERLAQEYKSTNRFVDSPKFTLTIGTADLFGEGQDSLNDLLDNFVQKIRPLLS